MKNCFQPHKLIYLCFAFLFRMTLFEQFGLGVKSYFTAISLLLKTRLWIYFIYPVLIYLLLFFAGFYFIDQLTTLAESGINDLLKLDNPPYWLGYLQTALHFFLFIGLKIIFYFIYSAFSKYIVLILMSPVMAILSAKTETIVTGISFPFETKQFLKDIFRACALALRNLCLQLLAVLLSFSLMWIPIAGWLLPFFVLLLSYYFCGFSMLDYVNERKKRSVSQSVIYIRKNKGIAIGNGFIFSVMFAIPFAGLVFVTMVAPVAACLAIMEKEKLEAKQI